MTQTMSSELTAMNLSIEVTITTKIKSAAVGVTRHLVWI